MGSPVIKILSNTQSLAASWQHSYASPAMLGDSVSFEGSACYQHAQLDLMHHVYYVADEGLEMV